MSLAKAEAEVLNENVTKWSASTITPTIIGDFTVTQGLTIRGEIGWHTHGSGDMKDVDMDLAIILESSTPITMNYNTFVMWALPI